MVFSAIIPPSFQDSIILGVCWKVRGTKSPLTLRGMQSFQDIQLLCVLCG